MKKIIVIFFMVVSIPLTSQIINDKFVMDKIVEFDNVKMCDGLLFPMFTDFTSIEHMVDFKIYEKMFLLSDVDTLIFDVDYDDNNKFTELTIRRNLETSKHDWEIFLKKLNYELLNNEWVLYRRYLKKGKIKVDKKIIYETVHILKDNNYYIKIINNRDNYITQCYE